MLHIHVELLLDHLVRQPRGQPLARLRGADVLSWRQKASLKWAVTRETIASIRSADERQTRPAQVARDQPRVGVNKEIVPSKSFIKAPVTEIGLRRRDKAPAGLEIRPCA